MMKGLTKVPNECIQNGHVRNCRGQRLVGFEVDDVTGGIATPIMTGITGTVVDMEGTIGAGMTIITATGVTPDRTGGTGSGIEIDRWSDWSTTGNL